MKLGDLAGLNVVIWGDGREGRAAWRALQSVTPHLQISDTKIEPRNSRDGVATGTEAEKALLRADVIVKSPGISPTGELYAAILRSKAVVTTGTNLWLADHRDDTIAVTGSKGKSTTSMLIATALRQLGIATTLAGNIGLPLLDAPSADVYVVELSSYQCASITQSPATVVFTSLFPDHLDWHETFENYAQAKLNLAMHGPNLVLANGYDLSLRKLLESASLSASLELVSPDGVAWIDASENIEMLDGSIIARSSIPAVGRHNAINAALAAATVGLLYPDRSPSGESLFHGFSPLPHRLEVVPTNDGVTWIDDVLATTPEAAIAALEAVSVDNITLIVGGADRGLSFDSFARYLNECQRVNEVVAIAPSGRRMAECIRVLGRLHPIEVDSLKTGMVEARRVTPRGGTVLLSPASPSFGEFENYEDRAQAFARFATKEASS